MLLRHGPASVRNLFSRHHWSRGRSIPGSWMVGSLIKVLFRTSTDWFCHRVHQMYWMVRASFQLLSLFVRIVWSQSILDVDNYLRMSAGAMLLRTGSQSVLVPRTAPVVVLMVVCSCSSTILVCAEFLQTGAEYSATE